MHYIVHSETTHYSGTHTCTVNTQKERIYFFFNNEHYISHISMEKITNERIRVNLFFIL